MRRDGLTRRLGRAELRKVMTITQKHLNANYCHITSKTERNPTIYVQILGNVSGDRWVSRYIFARVVSWKIDALFLKRNPFGIIRSTPTILTARQHAQM